MRAVYVPTRVVAGSPVWLEATAPAIEGGGTLTAYLTGANAPRTTALTFERLRQLLRHWAAADREGQGTLELDD